MTRRAALAAAARLACLSAAAAATLLSACTTMRDEIPPPPLDGTLWRLAALPGHALPATPAVTLQFEGGRAFGSDGCNRYTGPYTVTGADLQFGPPRAGTRMACPDGVRQSAEAYARALGLAARYRVVGTSPAQRLELLAADGRVVAAFTAQSQALAGTRWNVTGINNGRQAVASVQQGTRVTVAFDDQGRVSGSAGCNRFTARFEAGPGTVSIEAPAATRMACPEPGVMAQEQAFLRALEAARTARIEADQLELRDADGALQVSARADADRR